MNAEVRGTTLPILEVTLDAGDEVISTHGELSWMTSNIEMSQTVNTGSGKGLMAGLKRVAGGGGIFLTRYRATAGQGSVAFAAKMPGRIFPVEIGPQGGYLVHRHGWLCGTPGITPTVGLQQSFRGGLWGGEGFILEKLEGQGTAWIELSGEIVTYDLAPGQTLLVHPGHVGLFQDTVSFQITRVPGIANKVFGGDGYHLVALTGPGSIWLQSMPLSVLAASLAPFLGSETGTDAAVGGSLGGIIGGVLGRNV
jgi:uncharacterized protein (TIGR00266 family)